MSARPRRPSLWRRYMGGQRTSRVLIGAGLSGALIFAGTTGFGRTVRMVEPLPLQIDRALMAAGLGINEVMLSGHRYSTDADIYAALALDNAGSLLRYDVTGARRRVEALPWVRTAQVVRVLPDKLKIHIEERRPTAIWEHDKRTLLVDQTGRVLANLAGDRAPALALTRIAGAGAPRALARLQAALAPHTELASRLELARRVGERRWTLDLGGGLTVHLPADREGEALLRLARHHETSRILDNGAQIIDLRQDGVIAVRASPVTSPAAARAPGARSLL